MQGRMIAIVGPSGVGKDTVMAALQKSRPDLSLVKRHITRPPESIGEDHYALSSEEFSKAVDQQKFVLSWTAHGLLYGVSHEAVQKLYRGQDMLINLSRNILEEADDVFDHFIVINLTAPQEVLLNRLEERGREQIKDIKARIQRQIAPLPKSLRAYDVSNDRHLSATLHEIESMLFNESQTDERNFA